MDLCECRNHVFNSTNNKPIVGIRQLARPPTEYVPWEYNFERHNKAETKVPVVTIYFRRTPLLLFLYFVCQMAVLDEWNLLPTGLLMLQLGLTMTIEEFAKVARLEQQEQAFLQQRILEAKFEYHVLRGERHVQIVSLLEPDGSTTLYTV